jgi:hypothetical protein
VWGDITGRGEGEGRRLRDSIWLMDFMYLTEKEVKNLLQLLLVGKGLRGRNDGDNVNDV